MSVQTLERPIEQAAAGSLAGTTWSMQLQGGTWKIAFGTGNSATVTAPNNQSDTFNWAESGGHFWAQENGSLNFIWILAGSHNGGSGAGSSYCSSPGGHAVTPVPFTMAKKG